mgnify:CR=1 FL=1
MQLDESRLAVEAVQLGIPIDFVTMMLVEGLAYYYVDYDEDEPVNPTSKRVWEVAPPGMKKMVKAMKRAQKRGDIGKDSNVFALAWALKNKGAHSHYD